MSEPQPISWYALVMLAGHLVMAGTATWSLWVIGSGLWAGAAAALLLLIAYASLWRLRLAPAAQKRFSWLPASVGISMALLGDALASRSSSEGLETS